jgi:DNA polymerase V
MEQATDDASAITNAAIAVLEQIYDPRFAYKRAGVTLSGITRGGVISQSLFQEEQTDIETIRKSKRLMQALDKMNRGAGPHVIKLASELTHNEEGHNDGYSSSFGPPPEL